MHDDIDDSMTFAVVVNDEEQYSIWPAERATPVGWAVEGMKGSRRLCLEYIARVWTDMRPRSARPGGRGRAADADAQS